MHNNVRRLVVLCLLLARFIEQGSSVNANYFYPSLRIFSGERTQRIRSFSTIPHNRIVTALFWIADKSQGRMNYL